MNGTAHAVLGAAAGFITASTVESAPLETALFVGVGMIASLLPDIDVDGMLSNKISLSHKLIRPVAQLIGLLMVVYSFLEGDAAEKWLGMGIGAGMIVISSILTQRRMLTISGIGVLVGGITLQENWIMLLGVFIISASFLPHRSYTHSILGLLFFSGIAKGFEQSIGINGIFVTCMTSYFSHLVADMRFLPFNKRGVKLFLPLTSKEF